MTLSRRGLLGGLAALAGCATSNGAAAMLHPIGLQLYTLGDEIGGDLPGALRAVAEIGFSEVEVSNFYGQTGAAWRQLLDASGLTCTSLHVPLAPMMGLGGLSLADVPRVAGEAHAIGARFVGPSIFPFPASFERVAGENPGQMIARMARGMSADDWSRVADSLNEKGALLAREGLRIFYHNHNLEFLALGEGTALDLLIARTDPALVDVQLDVGWVAAAGIDPAAFITQHGPRISSLHVKDLTETPANTALVLHPANVGAGRQDWNAILRAAKAANVRHYFIEQEPPFAHPRIDAARAGFNFIKAKFQELDFRAV